jgi:excisionase family DNA binding protein
MALSLPLDRTTPHGDPRSDWYTVGQAIQRWPVSRGMVYGAIKRGELRAARLGAGRRRLVTCAEWMNEWLTRAATPQEIRR